MRMDMGFIHMSGYDKLMLTLGVLHCQLIANTVGFFRADLSRLEGLDNAVHKNVPAFGLAAPRDLVIKLFADFKLLRRSFRKGILSRGNLRFCRKEKKSARQTKAAPLMYLPYSENTKEFIKEHL